MKAGTTRFTFINTFVEWINWIVIATELADEAVTFADLKFKKIIRKF
jgi:hypothetical protein